MRFVVIASFAIVGFLAACSPCAFGFCTDPTGPGEGEGEGEGSSGEGEGSTPPSSSCQSDQQCQVADAGSGSCRQSADCGRGQLRVSSTGNSDTCVTELLGSDPPCEARSSKQLVTFTAASVEGQELQFCASPNVFCNNGTCTGGIFSP